MEAYDTSPQFIWYRQVIDIIIEEHTDTFDKYRKSFAAPLSVQTRWIEKLRTTGMDPSRAACIVVRASRIYF